MEEPKQEPKLISKTYIQKKTGETVIRQYNQNAYNRDYYEKNKVAMLETLECGCKGVYSIMSKWKHNQTKCHVKWTLTNKI